MEETKITDVEFTEVQPEVATGTVSQPPMDNEHVAEGAEQFSTPPAEANPEAVADVPSCGDCEGKGRVSDKESCDSCEGTGVRK